MNKLYSRDAAIKYLKQQTGMMTLKAFNAEVNAGRIPQKPYGNSFRYRQEDLDKWQTLTHIHHSESTNVGNTGTRTSHSALADAGLSFVKQQGVKMKRKQYNIA
jgi:hypothetical protein